MAKNYNMRWRSSDVEELNRVVSNFNNKVRYWDKKGQQTLPELQRVRDIRENIQSRQDYNRVLNSLKRFSNRGAEEVVSNKHGVEVTKWHLKEYSIARATRNRATNKRKKELDNLEIDLPGFDKPLTRAELGRTDSNEMRPLVDRFKTARNKKEFEKAFNTAIYQSDPNYFYIRDNRFKENWLNAARAYLQGADGYNELIQFVENMDPTEFYKLTLRNLDTSIEYIYRPEDIQQKVDHLMNSFRVNKNKNTQSTQLKSTKVKS